MSQEMVVEFPWSLVPQPAEGEKRSGYLIWPDVVLEGQRWPYIAVRGKHPGRAVAIVASIHGGEYTSILGALRLGRVLNPERVHGSLLVLPIANPPAFWERSEQVTPQDGKDLNELFPGRATGTFGEVLALRLTQDVISPANAVIDLHSRDVNRLAVSHTVRHLTENAGIDDLTMAVAEAFGAPYVVNRPFPIRPTSLLGNATLLGKAALAVESGGASLAADEDVYPVYQGLINALRALGVLEGIRPPTDVRLLSPSAVVAAPADGLWRATVRAEQRVRAGELLGTMTDSLGEEIARINAESAGIVLSCLAALPVRAGEPLVDLATE